MAIWKSLVEGADYLYAPDATNCEFQHNTSVAYSCETVIYVGETEDDYHAFKKRNGEMLYVPNTAFIYEAVQPKRRRLH